VVEGHLQVDQGKSGGKTKLGIPISLRLDVVGWTLSEVIKSCRTPGLLSHHLLHHRTKGGRHEAGDPVDDDTLSEAFAAARDAAGIKTAEGRTPPTFHEIRSLAIRLYTDQYGKEFAQALAGHKDVKMTDLYSDERTRQSVRVMVPVPPSPNVLDKF
jgi:integrase